MKRFNQVLLLITISILAASGLAKTASAVAATEHGSLIVAKASGDGETKDDSRASQHTTQHPSDRDGEVQDDTYASHGHRSEHEETHNGTNHQGVHHSESPNGDGDGETNDDG